MRSLLVGSAALALAAVTPKALLQGLLTQPVRKAELPAGVAKAVVSKRQPGATSRRHHVVGEAEIVLTGPHGGRVVYVVFPTHADALANHADGVRQLPAVGGVKKVKKQLAGLPKPNLLVDASVNLVGITQVSFVTENLEIATQSIVPNAPSGNEKDAIALAKFALRHLHAVEGRLR